MNLRSSLACTSSDIARWGLRSVLKRQGGVLPGRIAMKIDPELQARDERRFMKPFLT